MKIPKVVWIDAIGVGLFTTVYCLIMSGFNLWMGSAAFIAVSYFFGAGFPKDKVGNILLSFALGIGWGLLAHWLLLNQWLAQTVPSAIMFGVLTFIVLFLQGTLLPFTIVPAWLIAWGTTMLIISNTPVHNWLVFSLQLFVSMVLGIVVIGFASDYFKRWLLRSKDK